jgi:hypothetical protein
LIFDFSFSSLRSPSALPSSHLELSYQRQAHDRFRPPILARGVKGTTKTKCDDKAKLCTELRKSKQQREKRRTTDAVKEDDKDAEKKKHKNMPRELEGTDPSLRDSSVKRSHTTEGAE